MQPLKIALIVGATLLSAVSVGVAIASAQTTTSGSQTPSVPTGFAQSFNNTSTGISLRWDGVSAQVLYRIERGSSAGAWTTIVETTITTHTDTAVSPGVSYSYRIKSCVSTACSDYAIITGLIVESSPPTILPPVLSVTALSSTNPVPALSWSSVSGASYYKIFRKLSSTSVWSTEPTVPNVTETAYIDSNVSVDATYEYYLLACNPNLICSQPSNTKVITVKAPSFSLDTTPPSAPAVLVATKNEYNVVDIKWYASSDNVGVAGYIVNRSKSGEWIQLGITETTTFSDTTVAPSTAYYYSVNAYDAAGNKSATSTMLFLNTPGVPNTTTATTSNTTTVTAPIAPSNLTAVASFSTVYLSWVDNSNNESGFKLYRAINGLWTDIGNLPANTTQYPNTGLPAGVYEYKVQAFTTGINATAPMYSSPSSSVLATIERSTTATEATTTTTTTTSTPNTSTTTTATPKTVQVGVSKGVVQCDGITPRALVTFYANPSNGVVFKLLQQAVLVNEFLPSTMPLLGGTYHWVAIPKQGFTLVGSSEGDFVLNKICVATVVPASTVVTATTPVGNQTTVTPTTVPAPVIPPPTTPVLAPLPSLEVTTVETIVTPAQYVTYCDDPKHASACKSYATEKVIPPVIIPVTVGTAVTETDFITERGVSIPGGVTDASHLDSICAQSQYAASCADFLVTTGALSRSEANKRAEGLITARLQEIKTIEERDGSRMFLDTDTDSITDYDELNMYHSDPKKKDTDGDKVADGQELLGGTNPLIANETSPASTTSATLDAKIGTTTTQIKNEKIQYEDPRIAGDTKHKFFGTTTLQTEVTTRGAATGTLATKITLRGKALPNSFVTIYVYSEPIVVTVKTDDSGAWTYTLDKELPDGNHQIFSAITDTGGRILAKSDPLPFVKVASAVSLGSSVLLPPTNEEPGFFSGDAIIGLVILLAGVIGIAISVIGFVANKGGSQNPPIGMA